MVKSVQYINPKVSSHALYVSYILGFISFVMTIRCTWDTCWYITVAPTAFAAYTNCYGLWSFCDDKGTCGKWFAGAHLAPHPMERLFGRIGMILSIILSGASIIFLTFGLPVVGLMTFTTSTKRSLANSSGILFLAASIITFCVVLTHTITRAKMVAAGEPTDLGSAIFTGFIASGIGFVAGVIIFFGKWIVSLPYRDIQNQGGSFIPNAGMDEGVADTNFGQQSNLGAYSQSMHNNGIPAFTAGSGSMLPNNAGIQVPHHSHYTQPYSLQPSQVALGQSQVSTNHLHPMSVNPASYHSHVVPQQHHQQQNRQVYTYPTNPKFQSMKSPTKVAFDTGSRSQTTNQTNLSDYI